MAKPSCLFLTYEYSLDVAEQNFKPKHPYQMQIWISQWKVTCDCYIEYYLFVLVGQYCWPVLVSVLLWVLLRGQLLCGCCQIVNHSYSEISKMQEGQIHIMNRRLQQILRESTFLLALHGKNYAERKILRMHNQDHQVSLEYLKERHQKQIRLVQMLRWSNLPFLYYSDLKSCWKTQKIYQQKPVTIPTAWI